MFSADVCARSFYGALFKCARAISATLTKITGMRYVAQTFYLHLIQVKHRQFSSVDSKCYESGAKVSKSFTL